MPSCPKCGTYSNVNQLRCPRCATQLLFPLESLIASLKGEFPNRILHAGMRYAYMHDGLLYNGAIDPPQVKKGQTAWLRQLVQSCYIGPVEFGIRASAHSALRNTPIGSVRAHLGALEFAELSIPIGVTPETGDGKKQVDFNIWCKPFEGTRKITDVDVSKVSSDFATVVKSAKQVIGGPWKIGPGVRSDSGAMWMKIHYEVLKDVAPKSQGGEKPVLRTLWPVAT